MRGVQSAEEFALDSPDAGPEESRASLEDVFRTHHAAIVGMLARLTGDRGHAEDIAGEVFCKLTRRPAILRGKDLTKWVYRVATNAGLDALRAAARRRRREEAAILESRRTAEPSGALDDILREERRGRVRAVLASLKPRDAQMLLLRSSGMAYREIASSLGVSPGSVGTLLARAEAAFERGYLARYGDVK